MSGKSFDDNLSVNGGDETTILPSPLVKITSNTDLNITKKIKRIEKKFERMSSDLDNNDLDLYQKEFDQTVSGISKDDVNNLQSDFSKISWDESISVTTTAEGGLNTPDNDLQDLSTQGEGE